MFVFAVHGNLVIFSRVGKKSREVCAPRPYPSLSLSLSLSLCVHVCMCVCVWVGVCMCVCVPLLCGAGCFFFFFGRFDRMSFPPHSMYTLHHARCAHVSCRFSVRSFASADVSFFPPRRMCTLHHVLCAHLFFGSVVCIGRCVLFSTTPDVYTPPRFMCTPFFSVRSFASVDVSFFPPRRMCTLHHVLCAHLFSVRS